MKVDSLETTNGPLGLTVADTGSTRTVSLDGELDLATVATLNGAIEDCVVDGPEVVVIDLGRLEFIDSSGLAALLLADELLGREKDALRIVPSEAFAVKRVFDLCGLNSALPFVPVETARD